jgi:hypothetical protein
MKSLLKNVRNAVLAISAISLMLPNTLWAKGPSGTMSGVGSHVAGHSTIAAVNRSNSSNPTLSFSNDIGSDKNQSLKVNQGITNPTQPGGYHGDRNKSDSPVGSSTVATLTQKSSVGTAK